MVDTASAFAWWLCAQLKLQVELARFVGKVGRADKTDGGRATPSKENTEIDESNEIRIVVPRTAVQPGTLQPRLRPACASPASQVAGVALLQHSCQPRNEEERAGQDLTISHEAHPVGPPVNTGAGRGAGQFEQRQGLGC